MKHRLTYRKRHSYASKSNQTRVVKTPEEAGVPVNQDESEWAEMPGHRQEDPGIPHLRPAEYKRSRLPRNRTVNRPYDGVSIWSGSEGKVIIRAFSVEEQKIVKKVLKIQKVKDKQSTK